MAEMTWFERDTVVAAGYPIRRKRGSYFILGYFILSHGAGGSLLLLLFFLSLISLGLYFFLCGFLIWEFGFYVMRFIRKDYPWARQTYSGVFFFVYLAISIYLSGNWNFGALGSTSLNGWDYIFNSLLNKIIRVNRGWGGDLHCQGAGEAGCGEHVKESRGELWGELWGCMTEGGGGAGRGGAG